MGEAKRKRDRGARGGAAEQVTNELRGLFSAAQSGAYWPKKQKALAAGDHGIIVVGVHECGALAPGWVKVLDRKGDECCVEVKARRVREPGADFQDVGQIDITHSEVRTVSIREILPITADAFAEAVTGKPSHSVDFMVGKDFDRSGGRWIAANYGMRDKCFVGPSGDVLFV